MKYKIYTDGGCYPNPGFGSYAYVILNSDETVIVKQSVKSMNQTTNNRMEYMALICAVRDCKTDDEIELFTDSQLLSNTFNKWMDAWERNDWNRRKKKENWVKNLDLVMELFKIKKSYPYLKINWIRGHDLNKWNEFVDNLCSEEISSKVKYLR